MEKIKFFTKFDPPSSPALECKDASLTRQEFVVESDLNNIMKRYAAGMPIPIGNRPPLFGDFSDIPDFQKSFDIVARATDLFGQLPSDVRKRFDNNPQLLLAFLQDSSNREEAIKLGLIAKPLDKPLASSGASVSVPETKSVEGEGE